MNANEAHPADWEELQTLWRRVDQSLDQTVRLQRAQLELAGRERVRRRLDWFRLWPAIDVAFAITVCWLAGSVVGDAWPRLSIVIPGLGLLIAGGALLGSSIWQLTLASRIVWDSPLAEVQTLLFDLRRARLVQFQWVILLSPLAGWCAVCVLAQIVLHVDVAATFDRVWVMSNFLFGVLFVPLGKFAASRLERWFAKSTAWRSLIEDISGRSLAQLSRELEGWRDVAGG